MKDYFIRQFSYDHYANDKILEAIIKAANPEKTINLMAHLLVAQQVWLNRCKALPTVNATLWPDWEADSLSGIINQNSEDWLNYLNNLQPADFEQTISYKTLKGDHFENKLIDIFGHVINHGTHHRAQIGQQLKFSGVESLPMTDYIFYLRTI